MNSEPPGFVKIIFSIVILAALIFVIYWLWQRQPRPKIQEVNSPTIQEKAPDAKTLSFEIKPADSTVLTTSNIKLEGKSKPDSFIAVISDNFHLIAKSDSLGKFEQEIKLTNGLNLIDLVTIAKDAKVQNKISLTYFLPEENPKIKIDPKTIGSHVFAGSIKNIFDKVITISTVNGEKKLETQQSTQIEIPQEEGPESTKSALSNLRVGDYLIALGDLVNDSLKTKKVITIRENKPHVTKIVTTGKILTNVRLNLFSAKLTADGKIEEFSLSKNTEITLNDQKTKQEDISKDKSAIIIYHEESDKKIVDLVYLLP